MKNETDGQNPSISGALSLPTPSVRREIKVFLQHLNGLETSLNLLMSMMERVNHNGTERLTRYLADHGTLQEGEDLGRTYSLGVEYRSKFEQLRGKNMDVRIGQNILPKSFLVALVSQYDFFLGRLLRCLFYFQPELLNASEKSFTFTQLLSLGSVEAAREFLLEKEIESVLRESHIEQFNWLEKKFSVTLRKDLDIWAAFVELTERRNLFVHTNGVVSAQYLSVCKQHGVVLDNKVKRGFSLTVPPQYFKEAYKCIYEVGVKLAQVLWRKIKPEELEQADQSLIDASFDLLTVERYDLAITVLGFAIHTIKRYSSEEARRILAINLAQAYKWKGDEEGCSLLLAKDDWTACSDKFQLGRTVLMDDYSSAAKIMKRIGQHEEFPEHVYKDWPLFKEFRKSEEFREAHTQIFGHLPSENVTTDVPSTEVTPSEGLDDDGVE